MGETGRLGVLWSAGRRRYRLQLSVLAHLLLEVAPLKEKGDVYQADEYRHLYQRSDDGSEGTPEPMPNTATATAMASSKLLEAAVKERVAVLL